MLVIHPIDRRRWLATFLYVFSAVLRDRRGELLEIAREGLRRRIPDRPEDEALDHLPPLVDHLIDELDKCDAQGEEADFALVQREAAEHGRQREKLGIDVAHVVNDYGLVCDAVAELAKRYEFEVPPGDWQMLNRALDACIAAAMSSYQCQNVAKIRQQTALHLGGVAHDLRNSLATVSAAFEAIEHGRVGVTSKTSDVLERHLRYLTDIVNDLVGESKLSSGVPVVREAVMVGGCVSSRRGSSTACRAPSGTCVALRERCFDAERLGMSAAGQHRPVQSLVYDDVVARHAFGEEPRFEV